MVDNLTTQCDDEPCRELEVPRQMESLSNEIREAVAVVQELRSRLVPVLRAESVAPGEDKMQAPPALSPLAEGIRESAETVAALTVMVREMLSRLEV